jgi:hydroxymethylbilane synthase
MEKIIFATRPSKLARWQTGYVIQRLQQATPGLVCEEKVITTRGDKVLDSPLPEIGGKGLFTQELEAELLAGNVDLAVHSLKDLPVEDAPGLVVGAIPERADPRDVLVSSADETIASLREGAVVGTSSLRRQAQLQHLRPDLVIKPIRGNVDTRIGKVTDGDYDAAIMAGAGITRLGLDARISEWLPFDVMLPAPGQGALGIQFRAGDERIQESLAVIHHQPTALAVRAERAFLLALGGGCSIPVGAYARAADGMLTLEGVVASVDGKRIIKVSDQGTFPEELGESLAQKALEQGAGEILNE